VQRWEGLECCHRRRELEKRTRSGYISFLKISEIQREHIAMEVNLKKTLLCFFTNISEEQVRKEDITTEVNLKKKTQSGHVFCFFFKFVKQTVISRVTTLQ